MRLPFKIIPVDSDREMWLVLCGVLVFFVCFSHAQREYRLILTSTPGAFVSMTCFHPRTRCSEQQQLPGAAVAVRRRQTGKRDFPF